MNLIELYNGSTNEIEIYDTDTDFGLNMWEKVVFDPWTSEVPFFTISTFEHILKGLSEYGWNVLYRYTISYTEIRDNKEVEEQAICIFGDKDIKEAGGIFNVLSNHIHSRKIKQAWKVSERQAFIKITYYNTLNKKRMDEESKGENDAK